MLFVAVVLPIQLETIADPGAKISRQVPKLLYEALASALVVAPTVIAVGSLDGE
jgi:hypothetical protein